MLKPIRFPVVWLTILILGVAAAATQDVFVGGIILAAGLPAVLFVQWLIRWVFNRFGSPVWARRIAMFVPLLILAFPLFRCVKDIRDPQTAALRVALAGKIPTGIRELHVREDAWTDDTIWVYFRSDPDALRRILEQPPFERTLIDEVFSFESSPFQDLKKLPDVPHALCYTRSDMKSERTFSHLCTDSSFSFIYIEHAAD